MTNKKENSQNVNRLKELIAITKKNKDLGKYASTLDNSIYSNIDEWISTGSYALNGLISGDLFKGIPRGRVFGFGGPSGAGKSFLCGRIIANAQEMGYLTIILDSENAISSEFLSNVGCNTEEILYVPVDTHQEVRNYIMNDVVQWLENDPDAKLLLVLDSFGNLSSEKENEDIRKKKTNADMGEQAKAGKSMMRAITKASAKTRVPVLYTNHVYVENPMFGAPITHHRGGQSGIYMSSGICNLTKKIEKDETTKQTTGNFFIAYSDKNRLNRDKRSTELYVSQTKGPNKYYGLLPYAIEAGLIKEINSKNFEVVETGEKIRINNLYTSKVFTEDFLVKLNEWYKNKFKYASVVDDGLDDIEMSDEVYDD